MLENYNLEKNISQSKIQGFSTAPLFSFVLFVDNDSPRIEKILKTHIYNNFEFVLVFGIGFGIQVSIITSVVLQLDPWHSCSWIVASLLNWYSRVNCNSYDFEFDHPPIFDDHLG